MRSLPASRQALPASEEGRGPEPEAGTCQSGSVEGPGWQPPRPTQPRRQKARAALLGPVEEEWHCPTTFGTLPQNPTASCSGNAKFVRGDPRPAGHNQHAVGPFGSGEGIPTLGVDRGVAVEATCLVTVVPTTVHGSPGTTDGRLPISRKCARRLGLAGWLGWGWVAGLGGWGLTWDWLGIDLGLGWFG